MDVYTLLGTNKNTFFRHVVCSLKFPGIPVSNKLFMIYPVERKIESNLNYT